MFSRLIAIMIIIAAISSFSFAIDNNEMPFGTYNWDTISKLSFSEHLRDMRDTLGINFIYNYLTFKQIEEAADSGISIIMQGRAAHPIYTYSHYNYAIIEAEERDNFIRMYSCGGRIDSSNGEKYWVSESGSSDMLFGPSGLNSPCTFSPRYFIKLERVYPSLADSADAGEKITYEVYVRMKLEDVGGRDDVVCRIRAAFGPWDGLAVDTLELAEISKSDFKAASSWQEFSGKFQIPDDIAYRTLANEILHKKQSNSIGVAVIVQTTGRQAVYVDRMKICDPTGRRLVEESYYDDEIAAYLKNYRDFNSVIGWYMRDEPFWINLPVHGALLKTARRLAGRPDWISIAAINYPEYYGFWIDWSGSGVVTPDIYPFKNNSPSAVTKYIGYDAKSKNNLTSLLFQNRLDSYAERCSLAYHEANRAGYDHWPFVQCFGGKEIEGTTWRKPTPSELACQVYMALAEGARGLVFWKYGKTGMHVDRWISGMYDTTQVKTDLWYKIKDDINPYIKAIDSTFLTLTLSDSYPISPKVKPPDDGGVKSIQAYSYLSLPNPDLGWFQVGEFHDQAGDKYFMLVNRACNSDSLGTEAPRALAFLRLDQSIINSDFAYIIDLAHELNRVNGEWRAVPDTTLTAVLADGTIPYATFLKAGEGRLYKIVPADF